MPGETTRIPLTRWPQRVARATVVAYRRALGEGLEHSEAMALAGAAYDAAGGNPAEVNTAIPEMLAAAARDHGAWFWRPAKERIAREERWLKACGVWPPPLNRHLWPPMPDGFS